MKRLLFCGLIAVSLSAFANDYQDGRLFADNARIAALSGLSDLKDNENTYLNDFTRNPSESHLNQNTLKEEGIKEALRNSTGQEIIEKQHEREKNPATIDLNSTEMRDAGKSIDGADTRVGEANIPCTDGQCLPTEEVLGNDFGEGASRLGVLVGVAKEVADIGQQNPSIFAGTNNQCRIAVAHVGNCCGKHAHLLHCRPEEKALRVAINSDRAIYVGKYCAHYKAKICFEEKESWCVFPSLLASIIQIQGRLGQLGINFGWVGRRTNAANCRGIAPAELERINFQQLNLGRLAQEFESRYIPKNAEKIDADTASKIEAMEKEGKAHG